MNRWRGAWWFLGAMALGGCASMPSIRSGSSAHEMPRSLRGRDGAAEAAVPLSSGGGQDRATKRISLVDVVTRAREHALSVLEAAANLEAASGRLQRVAGELLPSASLDLGANYINGRGINNAGAILDDLDYGRFEPSVGLYYRVNPGAVWARSAAERHNSDAAALSVEEARRLAALQAAIGYLDLALAFAEQQIANQLVEDGQRFVGITEARSQVEIGSGADVVRAQADVARARQQAIRAGARWEQASIRLAVLLRWSPDERLLPREPELRTDALIDTSASTELEEEALRSRPDLQAARARHNAREADTAAAWWQLLGPEIDAGLTERLFGRRLNNLDRTTLAYAFLRFSVGFDDVGRVREANALAEAAEIRERSLTDRVLGEIETALSRVSAAERVVPEARNAVKATQRSYDIQVARFEAGTGLGIEVIEAQNARAQAQQGLATAILRYNAAQLELAAAIGHLDPELLTESRARPSQR